MLIKITGVIALLVLVSGCSKQQVYQGLYEGFRTRNELQSVPSERVGKPDVPGYQTYQQELNSRKAQEPVTSQGQ